MTYERRMLIIISLLILFNVLALSGCGILQRTGDAIFNSIEKDKQVTPETSKDALWQTVKKAKDNLFTSMAIPIVALGAAVIYLGFKKLGMACVIFGAVNLIMSLASARFSFWMALFGFIGTMVALAASILAKNKAVKELVYNIQDIKQTARDDNLDIVYQDKIKEELTKQTKSTKKIISNIKAKLK